MIVASECPSAKDADLRKLRQERRRTVIDPHIPKQGSPGGLAEWSAQRYLYVPVCQKRFEVVSPGSSSARLFQFEPYAVRSWNVPLVGFFHTILSPRTIAFDLGCHTHSPEALAALTV